MRFRGILDVGGKGAGERLGALYQDAELAGRFLVPLGLRLPGVPLASQRGTPATRCPGLRNPDNLDT